MWLLCNIHPHPGRARLHQKVEVKAFQPPCQPALCHLCRRCSYFCTSGWDHLPGHTGCISLTGLEAQEGRARAVTPQHPTKGRERRGSEDRRPMFPRNRMMGRACPVNHVPTNHTPQTHCSLRCQISVSRVSRTSWPPSSPRRRPSSSFSERMMPCRTTGSGLPWYGRGSG